MLGLLYYGRLEKEKGFDSLIAAIQILQKKKVPFEIFIFWSWSLESELLPLTCRNVHYFWFQPLSKIKQYIHNVHYCLMPSEFLETFGLVALNALSRGLPVIGYKKWWLEPFIFGDCNLFAYKGKDTTARLVHIIEKLSALSLDDLKEKDKKYKTEISTLLQHYTEESWYKNFLNLSTTQAPQKIVLVSDFINKIGGIETYLHDSKAILEAQGHEVLLRGGSLSKGWKWKLKIYFGLLFAPFNIFAAWKFKKFLKKEQPDLIWFNSLLRNLGRGVVEVATKYKHSLDCHVSTSSHSQWHVKLWMIYHDFGYFYPYPHKLFFVEDCKTPFSYKNFMFATRKEWIISTFAVWCKYFWLKGLVKVLKQGIDLHLVPSEFMVKIVIDSYKLSEKKVKAFNHFIQK